MDNKTEVWLRHPEIEKIEVSSFGRVRTLDKVVPCRGNGTRLVKGRILKPASNGHGYLQVNVKIDGKFINKSVHRLAARTFILNPDNLPEVNHKDCDRTNNNASNLEWVTHSYNMKYREEFGESASKPVFAINLNTLEVSRFLSQKEASRVLGISVSRISIVVNNRYRQANGFWFTNADDKAVDLTKQKLREIGKTKLTAADEASADFVSQVISE